MLERRGAQRLGCRRQLGTSKKQKSTPLNEDRIQGQQQKHVTQQREQDTRQHTSQHYRKCKRLPEQPLYPLLNKGLDHGEQSNLGKKRRQNKGGGSNYDNDTHPTTCQDDDNPCIRTENISSHDSPNWEPIQDEEDNVGVLSPSEPQEEEHNPNHDCFAKQGIGEEGRKLCKNGNWSTKTMELAFEKLDDGYLMPEVSAFFNIPRSSLRDHYLGKTTSRKRGPQGVLTAEEEQALVGYLDKMIALGHPLNPSQLKLKVAEITQERVTPFKDGIPGESWLKWFKNRHPQFIARVAQGLEMGRAKALCPMNVATFYDNLETMYTTDGYAADHIWNVDESGAQSGKEGGKVLARKGQRHVQIIIPNGTESLTVLSAINASGEIIPNFYIFRGWQRRRDYIVFYEPFATMAMQKKGWMNIFLFSQWIGHFIEALTTKGGIAHTNRHLMILDGHNSHVTLEVIDQAREAGLDMITLPSHTSHALQPLDVAVFKPFKTAFRAYRDVWTMNHKGNIPRKEDLAQWVSLALKRAASPHNIKAGFRSTGIWPFNPEKMKLKMQPSEGFRVIAPEVSISEIIDEDTTRPEHVTHYFVDVEDDSSTEDVHHSHLEESANNPPNDISEFLRLPQHVQRPLRVGTNPLVDYSKSHILTSDQYCETMDFRAARKADAIEGAKKKKNDANITKERKMLEKSEKDAAKKTRIAEKEAKKVFDLQWTPSAIRDAWTRLQQLVRTSDIPSQLKSNCGYIPPQCKANQAIAISRLKAKQARREGVNTITMPKFPPLIEVPGTYAFWSTHGASTWRQHQQHSTMNQFSNTIQSSTIRSNPAVPLFHNNPSQ